MVYGPVAEWHRRQPAKLLTRVRIPAGPLIDSEGKMTKMTLAVTAPECNKPNMLLWVEALESGKFPQSHGALRNRGGFCCLGVACEVAIQNRLPVEIRVIQPDHEEGREVYHYDGDTAILPRSVVDWLGLQQPNPIISSVHVSSANIVEEDSYFLDATAANDSCQWTFDEIAAAIRVHYQLGDKS